MIRRMGHHYSSLLLSSENTYRAINKDATKDDNKDNQHNIGSTVPTSDLISAVTNMLEKINKKPSCLLSNVVKSPSI
jgi:hypothetical protein